jgi:acyl-CoA reductase-like NAD-dependent aldehyde dehydrogenase
VFPLAAHTPLTVLAAMEALIAAGVPKGLVNILPGDGAFGDALVRHLGVHAIGFIGSSATGAKIQAAAGLKRSIMECSGNGPLVVLADADLDAAAKAAVDGAYPCAGQVCCATERVIVDAAVHDAFVDAVLREAERIVLYYEFTVVDAVQENSLLSREESFGPVVPIITGRGEDRRTPRDLVRDHDGWAVRRHGRGHLSRRWALHRPRQRTHAPHRRDHRHRVLLRP